MKEAYAYIRVSTEEQDPTNQLIKIREWALENGFSIPEENIFIDIMSGAVPPEERPKFRELLERVEKRPLPILVFEISRLGRSFGEVFSIIERLERLGASVISISPKESFLQTLDPSIRKLILAIFSWVAERERELLIERIKAGMERARREGKHIGRKRIEIPARKLKEYLDKGIPMTVIAKIFNVSYSTIRRRVKELGLKPRWGGPR